MAHGVTVPKRHRDPRQNGKIPRIVLKLLAAMKTELQAEKRKSISELHRSRYKRNSISKNADESRRRRLAVDQALRRKHREQLITAKRFRHLTQQEEYESAGEEEGSIDII
jgi:hypothetical protein